MGGGISAQSTDAIRQDWLEAFTAMQLNSGDVKKLNKVFNFIDDEKAGSVNITKVLTLLDLERTRFNERIFSTLDKENSGRIDLYAFVVSLWKFCSLESTAINAFVFEIYDTDADGKISLEQIEKMFKDLFGEKGVEQDLNKSAMVDLIKKTSFEGMLTLKNFQAFCKTRQTLLSPVFNVQKGLQAATLGVSGYESLGNRVIELHHGRSLTVKEVLALHTDRVLFRNLLDSDLEVQIVSDVTRTILVSTVQSARYITVLKVNTGELSIDTSASSSVVSANGPTSGDRGSRASRGTFETTPTSRSPVNTANNISFATFSVTPTNTNAASSGKNSRKARSTFVVEGPPTLSHKAPARRTMSQGRMPKD